MIQVSEKKLIIHSIFLSTWWKEGAGIQGY